jgi:filamentous hemagglutinin family protein
MHTSTRKFLAKLMCLTMLHSSLVTPLYAIAQVVVNPASGNTKVYTAPTGVTVIDINTANATGLSHNKFDKFNIDAKGLVLNNGGGNQISRNSQLAGQVFTNFNLNNEATLILNEVVSPNRSLLNGYLEVVGGRADVVVANPYGITCGGCGFINTSRATLTTGSPLLGANGGLNGFNITGGDILINGFGVDARNATLFDVLARSVKIDGQINAQDLKIVGGNHQFDYASRNATAQAGNGGTAPNFAIDSTALGGMYANRISLVATEAGVGVRMLGEAAASGDDFRVDAAGKVQLQNRVSAKRDLTIASNSAGGGIDFSGANAALSSNHDINLSATNGTISLQEGVIKTDNQFILSAQSLQDSSSAPGGVKAARFASGNLNLNVSGAVNLDGTAWGSGAAFNANLGSLAIGNGGANLYSGADSNAANRGLLVSTNGNFVLANATVQSATDLSLLANGTLSSTANALVQAGTTLSTKANGNLTLAGKWQAIGAASFGAASVGANTQGNALQVDNSAQVQSGGNLSFGASGAVLGLNNTGSLLGDTISVFGADFNNGALVQAANGLQINAATLNNAQAGAIINTGVGKDVRLQVGQLANSGNLQSGGALALQATGAVNNSGTLASLSVAEGGNAGALALDAGSLNNSGLLSSGGALAANVRGDVINSATLQAGAGLDLVAGSLLDNRGSAAKLQGAGNVTLSGAVPVNNEGRIQAGALLNIGSAATRVGALNNRAGAVLLGDQLAIYSGALANDGLLQGSNGVQITAAALSNSANAQVLSTGVGRDVNLTLASLNNSGLLQSTGALQLAGSGALTNSGTLATIASDKGGSSGDATLSSATLTNSGTLAVAGNGNVSAGSISNSGSVAIAADGVLSAASKIENSGANSSVVVAGKLNLQGTSANTLALSNDGRLQAGRALTIGNAATPLAAISNSASGVVLGDTLQLDAVSLANSGLLQANNGASFALSGQLSNAASGSVITLGKGKDLLINAASVNSAGLLQSSGAFNATTSTSASTSAGFTNSGTLLTRNTADGGSDGNVTISAAELNNSGMLVASGKASLSAGNAAINNSGSILAVGDASLLTHTEINNSGASAKIISQANLSLTSDAPAFAINNDGRIQTSQALALGGVGHLANLSNSTSGQIVADQIKLNASKLSNAGVVQGNGRVDLDVTGQFGNSGTVLTTTSGATLVYNVGTLSNQGFIQSSGLLVGNSVGASDNSGTIITTSSSDGGANGMARLAASSVTNSGNIVSSGSMDLNTISGGIVNSQLIRSQGDLAITSAGAVQNSGSASVILGAANVSVTARNNSITLSNEGTIQAAQVLTLGNNDHQISALTNNASGVLLGDTLTSVGGTVSNAGIMQGNNGLTMSASGAVTNSGSILSTVATRDVTLGVGSLNNSGTVQSAGDLSVTSAGAITNSGNLINQDAAGNMSLSGSTFNNSGIVQAANTAALTTTSGAMDNTGAVRATGNLNATVATAFNNTGSSSRVLSNGNITIGTSAGSFAFTNDGGIGAGQVLSIGSGPRPAASLNNSASGILLGDTVAISAGTLDNLGMIQGSNGVTASASGALTNSGTILSTVATRDVSLTVGSTSNTGTIQSAGDLTIASSGSITNSGNLINQDAAGTMNLSGSTLNNSGIVQAANSASLVAASGAIDNTGAVRAGGNLDATVATAFNNTGSTSRVLSNGNITIGTSASNFAFANDGGIGAGQVLTIGSGPKPAASFNNSASAVLQGDTIAVTAGTLGNAGLVQAANGITASASGALTNDGTILTSSATRDISLTVASLTNTGTIQSAGDLTIASSGSIGNSGSLSNQDAAGNLNLSGSAFNNSGVVQAANTASLSATSAAIDNSGTIRATGALNAQVATAFNNTGAGSRVLGSNNVTIGTSASNFTLTNDGGIGTAGTLTLGSNPNPVSTLQNNAGGVLVGNSLTAFADTLNNPGTIQGESNLTLNVTGVLTNGGNLLAAASTVGARDLVANVGSLVNSGTIQADRNLTVTSNGTFDNSGTILTQGSDGTLSLSGTTLTNTAMVQAGNAASLNATTLNNSGTLQSSGAFGASVSTALNNSGAGAMILSDDNITLSSSAASFALANGGVVQAGGVLNLGTSGHVAVINNQSGAKLAGNSLVLQAGTIDNTGRIQALAGSTVNASSFTNHGSTSVFLAAADSTASSMTLSGALTNEGAIHGSGNFTINAASISNSDTAGISSLANLNLNSSGNISNAGAFYAGSQLNLSASGTVTNSATLAASQGTFDSGGSISVTANTFVNNSTVNATGDITISATTFKNETPGGDTRSYQRSSTTAAHQTGSDECYLAGFCSANRQITEHYASGYQDTQVFAGGTPQFKPQIIGSGILTIQNFSSGTNVGGVLSAATINLTGSGGGATFVNNDLSLNRQTYARTYDVYTEYIAAGPLTYHDHETRNDSGNVLQSTVQVSSIGAGIKAGTLNASGFGLTNLGSPFTASPSSTSASATGATVVSNASGALAAGALSGGSASGASGAGALNAANASSVGGAGALNAANASGASAASGASGGNVIRANGTGVISVGGVAGSNGAKGVAVAGVGKNNGTSGVALTGVIHLTGSGGTSVNINLPTNPNGFFVTIKDPNSQFLVTANPIFQVGANTVGSDYLAQRLGFNTNTIEKRLGDSNYEAYLVRQQLVSATGSNVLKGYRNEAAQIKGLYDAAAIEAGALGLQFGSPPTPDQLAHLSHDIVWMVDTEVAGQHVLAPVVYLAESTRNGIVGGAVIAADNLNFDGDSLNNVGGTISATNNLNVKTKGDITNTSGTITGGNVNLKAGGSILNETVAITDGSKFNAATTIGKTGTISATKNLSLDAGKDIAVKGADITAGGNASLSAGGNVTFDTIENRTSSESRSNSTTLGGSSSTHTQTASTTNIGSNLVTGGNLKINAGKAVNILGSNVDAKGDLDLKAKDGVNIIAKQDSVETNTESKTSGVGVGGGVWGSEKVKKNEFDGKNKAAGINVGGNATIQTDGNLVLLGSDLKVAGSANLEANDVQVLAGRDEKRSTTVTETVSFLSGAKGSSKSGTAVDPGSASADEKSRTAKAGVSAEATASAEGEVKLFSVKKDTTNTLDVTKRGSSISVGKNLNVKAKNDVTLEGADVQAGGNIKIDATNINILASEDVHTSNTTSEETSFKLSSSNKASAKADASAEANGVKLSASAQAEARAKASTDNVVGVANVKTNSTETATTHKGTVLKSGGNLDLTAKDQLTFQAAQVEAGGDVTLKAKDINTLTAQDTKTSTSNTESTVVGIYIAAEAEAGAKAEASAKVTGVGASAKADAGVEAGTGLHIEHGTTKDTSGSSKAVTTSIKSGGNLTRIAENKITDVGAQIAVGGDLTQSAKEINSLAAQNTEFSTSESDKHTVRVGVYGNAGASAGAEAKAGVGGVKAGANAEAHAVGGVKVGYTGANSTDSSASLTNTTGSIVVGGKLKSTSSGKTTIEATDIVVRGDTELSASSLDFKAVQDIKTSSSTSRDIDASLKVGAGVAASAGTEGGAKVGPQGEIKAGFNIDKTSANAASSTAVTGSLNTGGKLKITTTQGDIRLQGVDVTAGGDVALKSAGNVVVDAAQSTTSSTKDNLSVGVSLELKAGGGENSGSGGVNVGVDKGNKSSSTGKAGTIKSGGNLSVDAAKDITLEGTKVAAEGDVGLNAGGKVNLKAIKNTNVDQSTKVDVGVAVSGSASGGSGSLDLDVALKDKQQLASDAVSIQSGGKTKVTAKGDINQEGNVLKADQTQAGGKVTTTALQSVNKDSDIRFGISVDVEAEKKQKKGADGKPVEETAKPKDKVNQLIDKLTGFDKPATASTTGTAKKPAGDSTDPAKKPVEVADAGTPAKKPVKPADATDDPAAPAKKPAKPAADTAATDDGQAGALQPKPVKQPAVDPVKQRQADAEIAHLKRQGQTVDEGSVYKKWGVPLTDTQKASNAAKIPPFDKTKPRAQPTETQSRDAGWKDSAGKWVYPGDDGFKGKPQPTKLKVGDTIDRFGKDSGTFFAPVGTPLDQRAMAPGAEKDQLTKYKILKELPVSSGEIAPWFDQPGGGTQYKAEHSAKWLVDNGFIKPIEVIPAPPATPAAPK